MSEDKGINGITIINYCHFMLSASLNFNQIVVQMLLTFALRVHSVQNRLPLGRVFSVQFFDVLLHFHVNTAQSLLQILEAKKL